MNRQVVIVGGGVAGLEALMALHDLAGDRAEVTLVAPGPDFLYKPLLVEEPFDLGPAERHELAPLAEELGARFVQQAAKGVDPDQHTLELSDGSTLTYDFLVVCAGGRFRPALERALTFPSGGEELRIDELLQAEGQRRIAFVVPSGVTWTLPIYEIALMTRRRVERRRRRQAGLIVTPEEAPLIFGPRPARPWRRCSRTRNRGRGGRACERGGEIPDPEARRPADRSRRLVALPAMDGPGLPGLPHDEGGFIPIDDHARVIGTRGCLRGRGWYEVPDQAGRAGHATGRCCGRAHRRPPRRARVT